MVSPVIMSDIGKSCHHLALHLLQQSLRCGETLQIHCHRQHPVNQSHRIGKIRLHAVIVHVVYSDIGLAAVFMQGQQGGGNGKHRPGGAELPLRLCHTGNGDNILLKLLSLQICFQGVKIRSRHHAPFPVSKELLEIPLRLLILLRTQFLILLQDKAAIIIRLQGLAPVSPSYVLQENAPGCPVRDNVMHLQKEVQLLAAAENL